MIERIRIRLAEILRRIAAGIDAGGGPRPTK